MPSVLLPRREPPPPVFQVPPPVVSRQRRRPTLRGTIQTAARAAVHTVPPRPLREQRSRRCEILLFRLRRGAPPWHRDPPPQYHAPPLRH
eukprot:scaffold14955_cov67-Isochrysis_galbana.AAC.2